MTMFIRDDTAAIGGGLVNTAQAAVDLGIIARGDTGLGFGATVNHRQPVTYTRSQSGTPPTRLDALVNTAHMPDYGAGAQAVAIVLLPVRHDFTFSDGRSIQSAIGISLPPKSTGLPGHGLNTTEDCVVVYDTTDDNGIGYCLAHLGAPTTFDVRMPSAVLL